MKQFCQNYWGLGVVFLVSLIAIFPFFHTGFFPVHDNTQVERVFELGQSLKDGIFPVRWVQDLGYGYGYPIFTFYGPLAYYVGGVFLLGGLGAIAATKLMMIVGILLAGVTMYFLTKDIWGKSGGILSAALYMYAPYHALDIYVRGDVGEFWAYAFLPLVVYGMYKGVTSGKIRFLLIGSVGFAGIILSHNLSAFMVAPFLLILGIVLFGVSQKKLFMRLFPLLTLGLGLLIAAFYVLPVPFEMKYTNVLSQVGGGADFHNHFVCLSELWNSQWGFGGSVAGCTDGISFALGKLYIALSLLSICLLPFVFKIDKKRGWIILGALISTLLGCFFLLEQSRSIWEFISLLAFIQYPWRYLMVVVFGLSFLGGSGMWYFSQTKILKKHRWLVWSAVFLLLFCLVLVEAKYFQPQKYLLYTDAYYIDKTHIAWITSKISDEYMPKNFSKPTSAIQLPTTRFVIRQKDGIVVATEEKTQTKTARVTLLRKTTVHVNLAYFPAWHAYVDLKEVPIRVVSQGMDVIVPDGRHTIVLAYVQTPIELLANSMSITGILIGFLAIIIGGKYKLL